MGQRTDVTVLLSELAAGDAGAADRLMPLLYDELRALAGSFLRSERAGHTLQPTALVNEAYIKLLGNPNTGKPLQATSRVHFLALSARVMRQLLIDHARARRTQKRGGGGESHAKPASGRVRDSFVLAQTPSPDGPSDADVLDLEDALLELAAAYPRQAKVVELKFYGGLTSAEIGLVLGISDATVERDWTLARGWLNRKMTGSGLEGSGPEGAGADGAAP